jgi:hypothetical protein
MIDRNIEIIPPRSFLRIPVPEYKGEQCAEIEGEKEKREEKAILCAQCRHSITSPRERIDVHGLHRHTFFNPYGIIFEIGCFRVAPGCRYAGAATEEFSWFPGYHWKIAVCNACGSHLGWLYSAPDKDGFHGLILDTLIEPD